MKIEKEKVTSENGPDGQPVTLYVDVKQFDTLDEAVKELNADEALRLLNVQYKTTTMNRARQQVTGKITKTELRRRAMQRILQTPECLAEFTIMLGDPVKSDEYLQKYMDQIEAELNAERAKKLSEEQRAGGAGAGAEAGELVGAGSVSE